MDCATTVTFVTGTKNTHYTHFGFLIMTIIYCTLVNQQNAFYMFVYKTFAQEQ